MIPLLIKTHLQAAELYEYSLDSFNHLIIIQRPATSAGKKVYCVLLVFHCVFLTFKAGIGMLKNVSME